MFFLQCYSWRFLLVLAALYSSISYSQQTTKQNYRFSYENLTDSYIQKRIDAYNLKYNKRISFKKAKADLMSIASLAMQNTQLTPKDFDIAKFKVELEKILSHKHQDKVHEVNGEVEHGVVYNRDFNNLFEYLYEGKMQCDSGTQLLLAAHRLVIPDSKTYRAQRPMIVYTGGHIIYGQLQGDAKSPQLVGYETTVDGAGVHKLGALKNLHLRSTLARPLETDFYMAIDASKNLKEAERLAEVSLERLSVEYQLNRSIIERRIQEEKEKSALEEKAQRAPKSKNKKERRHRRKELFESIKQSLTSFANTTLGFGRSNAPEGDQKRGHSDRLDGESGTSNNIDFISISSTDDNLEGQVPSQINTNKTLPSQGDESRTDLVFLHIYQNRTLYFPDPPLDYEIEYGEHQLMAKDRDGNSPLLYAFRHAPAQRVTELFNLLNHKDLLFKRADALKSGYAFGFDQTMQSSLAPSLAQETELNYCREVNKLGENALLASLKNPYPDQVRQLFDLPSNMRCTNSDFFTQRDYEGNNALHLLGMSLAFSHNGWTPTDYQKLLDVILPIKKAYHANNLSDLESEGKGMLQTKNRYGQTPLELVLERLIFEDNPEQRFYLLKFAIELLGMNISNWEDSMACLDPESWTLLEASLSKMNLKGPLKSSTSNLLYKIKACEAEESFKDRIDHQALQYKGSTRLISYRIKKFDELATPFRYQEILSAIDSVDSANQTLYEGEDKLGQNLVLDIARSPYLSENQKLELFHRLEKRDFKITAKDFQKINIYNSNALNYACQQNQPKLLKYLVEKGVTQLLVARNGTSCAENIITDPKTNPTSELNLIIKELIGERGLSELVNWNHVIEVLLYKGRLDIVKNNLAYVLKTQVDLHELAQTLSLKSPAATEEFQVLNELLPKESKFTQRVIQAAYRNGNRELFEEVKGYFGDTLPISENTRITSHEQYQIYQDALQTQFKLPVTSILPLASDCEVMSSWLAEQSEVKTGSRDATNSAWQVFFESDCLSRTDMKLLLADLKVKFVTDFEEQLRVFTRFLPSSLNTDKYRFLIDEGFLDFGSAYCYGNLQKDKGLSFSVVKSFYKVLVEKADNEDNIHAFLSLNPPRIVKCIEQEVMFELGVGELGRFGGENEYYPKLILEHFDQQEKAPPRTGSATRAL